MKKLLLINPPQKETISGNLPAFVDESRGNIPPIGLMSTAAAVEKQKPDWEVKICDMSAGEKLEDYDRPDLAGITATTFTMIDVMKTASMVKNLWNSTVVVGGIHPTIYPEETANLPYIDCAYAGESEVSFPQMIELIAGKIANVVRGGKVDINKLPMPAYHLIDKNRYYSLIGKGKHSTSMFTSRGCPYHCIFCHRDTMGKEFRARSAIQVIEEIEMVAGMGTKEILFYDDTFTVDKHRVMQICKMIKDRKIDISFDIRSRVDTIDLNMLYALKDAGCKRIHYGVEASNNNILKKLGKGITIEQIEKALWTTKLLHMETLAYFMIGNPGETENDMLDTIEFAKRLDPTYCHFAILTPYPSTPLYQYGLKLNLHDDYWLKFARNPSKHWSPPYCNGYHKETMENILNKAYKEFYLRPKVILRELIKTREPKQFIKKASGALKVLGRY